MIYPGGNVLKYLKNQLWYGKGLLIITLQILVLKVVDVPIAQRHRLPLCEDRKVIFLSLI